MFENIDVVEYIYSYAKDFKKNGLMTAEKSGALAELFTEMTNILKEEEACGEQEGKKCNKA